MAPQLNDRIATEFAEELAWFTRVLETRLKLYFGHECEYANIHEVIPPDLVNSHTPYARLIDQLKLNINQRLLLLLTLVPHLQPQLLDPFFVKNATYDREFTEFGGQKGKSHTGFLPTGETALFLLAGDHLSDRMKCLQLFEKQDPLIKNKVVRMESGEGVSEPSLSGLLSVYENYLHFLLTGEEQKMSYSVDFPAQLLTTDMEWDDLVLNQSIRSQIDEILVWMEHGDKLLVEWNMHRKIKPGYRALFYGPPGTGKTLTATLLGKAMQRDVYRIDLSKVVSKYIGETEKNLAKVFDLAENKQWILFFDEADALFGKRTTVSSSHDRYANQEVSYLLQRIEDFPGVVILASNMRGNLDEAFTRRFQSIIHLPMPEQAERLELWKRGFSEHCELDIAVDLDQLAKSYELAGGSVMNVIRYGSLMALNRNSNNIRLEDLKKGIQKEFLKEGKTI
ncbi:ATP-binding protein [Ekhidna sp.]